MKTTPPTIADKSPTSDPTTNPPPGDSIRRKFGILFFLATVLTLTFACQKVIQEDDDTIIYHAENRDETWDGWGLSGPLPKNLVDHMTLETNDGSSPRVFSGQVVSRRKLDGLEVGLVSLVGVHWVNPKAYQWEPVAPDGSFSITDANYPDARKAIVLRGPETPWTFFPFNFGPDQSAKGILIRPQVGKKVTFTVSGEDLHPQPDLSFEVFPATMQRDRNGQPLRRQRLGQFRSGEQTEVECLLPLHPVSVLIGAKGFSRFYQTIDPREADHFHFVLQRGATMKVVLTNKDGQPLPGIKIRWVNPAAPLSISGGVTDANGVMVREGLAPGIFQVSAAGFPSQKIELKAGEESELKMAVAE